jgi:HEAT repeat protein
MRALRFLGFTIVLVLVMKAVAQTPTASAGILSPHEREAIAAMAPQQQAERLIERSVSKYTGALEEANRLLPEWFGKLHNQGSLKTLLMTAQNSSDLKVRELALEIYLAESSLAKNDETVAGLLRELDDSKNRSWRIWALSVLANRGFGADQTFRTLERLRRDDDVQVRKWVAEGFSIVGRDEGIPYLVEMFGQDTSMAVKERAGCGLAEGGMFRREQRLLAVPGLLTLVADASADPTARKWYYQALREITGQSFAEAPAEWQNWWATRR